MTKSERQAMKSRMRDPCTECGFAGRADLDQDEMDAIWARLDTAETNPMHDQPFKSIAHPMLHAVSDLPARPAELSLLKTWRHPATARDMSVMHGLHIEVVKFIADEMLMAGLMDDMEDGRLITNDEGIVHTRETPHEKAAMHALITSSTGALYFDEIQTRTHIMDHVVLTEALCALAAEGLVRSTGILYEIIRIPFSSR